MPIVFALLYLLLLVFFLALMVRLVFDWVQVFAREWKPRGVALLGASVVYSVTDPPLRLLRRLLPPLRLGSISLDLGFILLLIVVSLLMNFAGSLAL
ncbi:YggT family protein [Pseudarthrobacter sp. P1]|uniref:YggT family protein n=1 Tax=Pseudarthrobacter sp. P1 TaxID=3418418 RepID=UPI003CF9E1C6